MKVIEPTPSQAAVVMKNYLRSLGFEVSLANAQECFARSRGYADWNTLASQVEVRGRKAAAATEAQSPTAVSKEDKPEPVGPFDVYVNGGYYDTVAYYGQAMSMAEMFAAEEDPNLSEPFDSVTVEDASGEVVATFIQSHTRIRVYVDDDLWTTFPDTSAELHHELANLVDKQEEIRVEEYTLEVGLGIVGTTELPFTTTPYLYSPAANTTPAWEVRAKDGFSVLNEDGNSPLEFASLSEAKSWFSLHLERQGIHEEAILVPMAADLSHWEATTPNSAEAVLLIKHRRAVAG